jgi:hypothetical protein
MGTSSSALSSDLPILKNVKLKGFYDPEVSLKFRAFENPAVIDLSLLYSPESFDANNSYNTGNGSMGKGFHSFTGELETGNTFDRFSSSFGANGTFKTKGKYADGSNGTSGYEIEGLGKLQYIVAEIILLRGSLLYDFSSPHKDYSSTNRSYNKNSIHGIGGSAGIGMILVPDKFMLNIGFDYQKILDYKTTKATKYSGSTTIESDYYTFTDNSSTRLTIYGKFQF